MNLEKWVSLDCPVNSIVNVSCLDGMRLLSNESVDLVVCSPPYNVSHKPIKSGKVLYNQYADNMEYKDYIGWLRSIFEVTYDKLKVGGRVCINIGDAGNGKVTTHSDIIQFMKDIGYMVMTTIIWEKNQVSSRTAWGSFQSPSSPAFPVSHEYIMVFVKESLKLSYKGVTDITKEEFIKWSIPLWSFPGETRQKKISILQAMYPKELPYRCIKLFSWMHNELGEKSLIVDPFNGLGTTAKVAKTLGRNYIGFDINGDYVNISERRVEIPGDDVSDWVPHLMGTGGSYQMDLFVD